LSFLYSIFLPALAAAAIPVLLHFFSRQRLPLIDFSSLEFLQKLQKRQARRIQIRQIILLILRTLAVIALVLAFVRPALKANAVGDGSASSTEMVFILDDGYSTAASTRDGTIWQIELEYLETIFALIGTNDHATVLLTADPTKRIEINAAESQVRLDELRETSPRLFKAGFDLSLANADSILSSSQRFNRELYIISPFYGVSLDSVTLPPFDKTRVYLIGVGPDQIANIGIEKTEILSALRQKGRPVDFAATIRNYDTKAVADLPVSIYLGSERVAQGSVDVAAEGSTTKNFAFTITRTGMLSGSVRIEEPDGYSPDDRRFFTLDVPEQLTILIVAADSLELQILRSVFQSGPERYFVPTLRLGRNWETEPLNDYNALLIADLSTLSEGAVQRVARYVEDGGGLILMPGRMSDLADWSRGLLKQLGFQPVSGATMGGIKWEKFDTSHPLFSGVFEKAGSPAPPTLLFAANLSAGAGDLPVIPLASGNAFLLERTIGKGRALLFASPPSPVAGEFIFSGIFAPLLFRSGAYVATGGTGASDEWEVGSTQKPILPFSRVRELELVTPDGEVFQKQPRTVTGGVEYDVGRIETPGIYRFDTKESSVARFPANISPEAGSLHRLELNGLAGKFPSAKVLDKDRSKITEEVNSARFGRELWQPIAAMFLGLLIAESIVGRAGKKEEV